APWHDTTPWPCRMHRTIARALGDLGVISSCGNVAGPPFTGFLCFEHHTPGDVAIGAGKIVGSAQRRQRGALLQHGAVLLAASPYAPDLSGIQELSQRVLSTEEVVKAVTRMFAQQTGWDLVAADWTVDEIERIAQLVAGKY